MQTLFHGECIITQLLIDTKIIIHIKIVEGKDYPSEGPHWSYHDTKELATKLLDLQQEWQVVSMGAEKFLF